MKVGTKILTILVAPVLVLGVLAGIGVKERLADADSAGDVEQFAEVAAADSALVHELQLERNLTAEFMASGGQLGGEELERQRAGTDEAIERLRPLIDAVNLGASAAGMGDRLAAARTRLDGIDGIRESVDSGDVDTTVALDTYAQTVSALLTVNTEIAASTAVPELASAFNDYVALAKAKESSAQLSAGITAVLASGGYAPGQYDSFLTMLSDQQRYLARFFESQAADYKAQLRNALAESEVRETDAMQERILEDGAPGGDGTSEVLVEDWLEASVNRLDAYRGVEDSILGDVISKASKLSFSAEKAVRLYLAGAAAATLFALLLASVVARATTRPLRKLTKAANVLSAERIPRLVEELRSPETMEAQPTQIESIEVRSRDEIGQLAEAFNAIQNVTVEVAEEQAALLRKGIGDIFVNLARRNQSLLDRQIEYIDELEAHEEDPDQLEHLFKLDHLATRMRRNAESLLVLAGAEPPRRRARPVSLADVVRVAVGEVEDFTRINLLALDEVTVGGNVAVDLAHLLSELMENATHFSPPETQVEVVGQRGRDGSYMISVSDQGIGMSAEQLADANRQLAHPPLVGLALSRSLGFIVIGRLAARFGISVRLTASPAGGVTAIVTLPPGLVTDPSSDVPPIDEPVAAAAMIDNGQPLTAEPGSAPAPALEAAPAPEADVSPLTPPPVGESPAAPVEDFPPAPVEEHPAAPAPDGALFAEAQLPTPPAPPAPPAVDPIAPAAEPFPAAADPTGPIFGEDAPLPPVDQGPATPPLIDEPAPLFQDEATEQVPDPDFWGAPAAKDDGFPTFPEEDSRESFPSFPEPATGEGFPMAPNPEMPGPVGETPADALFGSPAPQEPALGATAPSNLKEALPEGPAFEEGLASLVGSPEAPPAPADPFGGSFEEPAPPAPADPFGGSFEEPAPPAPADPFGGSFEEPTPPPPPEPTPAPEQAFGAPAFPEPGPAQADPVDLWEQIAEAPAPPPPPPAPEASPLDELGAAAGWETPPVGGGPADSLLQPPTAPPSPLIGTDATAPAPPVPGAPTPEMPPAPPAAGGEDRLTASGLVRRSPKPVAPSPARPAPTGRRTAMSASQRSPEEVRAMLSRYRSGLKQGRQPTDPNDHSEERS